MGRYRERGLGINQGRHGKEVQVVAFDKCEGPQPTSVECGDWVVLRPFVVALVDDFLHEELRENGIRGKW